MLCCVILCRLQPGPGRVNLLYLIDSCLKQQNQLRTSGKPVHAQVRVSLSAVWVTYRRRRQQRWQGPSNAVPV